ncbi:MAG: T9SS type A sorting domain-containing protein, partial [Fibrobacteres bacterium]|nr:T9SS type A sorting domain-containing protein [Fibrobacterota bacterium]
ADGSKDGSNWFGVRSSATSGYDLFDAHKPPTSPVSSVSLAFENEGSLLSQSIKAPSGTNEWQIVVKSAKQQNIALSFDGITDLPDGWHAYLANGSELIEIKKSGTATVSVNGKRVYRVIVTNDPAYAQNQISSFELSQNSPNPFNPTTKVSFAIPVSYASDGSPLALTQSVSLKVYDLKGRLLRTLVNSELKSGSRFTATWNGLDNNNRPVSSGVYVYRIKVGNRFEQTRFMVMSR